MSQRPEGFKLDEAAITKGPHRSEPGDFAAPGEGDDRVSRAIRSGPQAAWRAAGVGCIDEPVAIVQASERFLSDIQHLALRRLRSVRHLESLSAAMHTALVLSRLVSLTGWSFVGVSACVFAAVAAAVHGALALDERIRRRWRKRFGDPP